MKRNIFAVPFVVSTENETKPINHSIDILGMRAVRNCLRFNSSCVDAIVSAMFRSKRCKLTNKKYSSVTAKLHQTQKMFSRKTETNIYCSRSRMIFLSFLKWQNCDVCQRKWKLLLVGCMIGNFDVFLSFFISLCFSFFALHSNRHQNELNLLFFFM